MFMLNDTTHKMLMGLSSLELVPFVMSYILNINYGASTIGKIHQDLNAKYNLAYVSWFSFDILIIYYIYILYKSKIKNKYLIIIIILILTYLAVYPFLQIGNAILSLTFKNGPFIKNYKKDYDFLDTIEKNYGIIKKEFLENNISSTCLHDDIVGFQISTGNKDNCWRSIILKKTGKLINSIKFPFVSKLLDNPLIHNAMFSILDGGVNIPPHTGYYKGYLRYHLGIEVPTENGISPFIVCGDEKYSWKNGEGVLFDDMFLHYVENPTSKSRIVLYLDILRIDIPFVVQPIYNIFNKYIETHPTVSTLVQNSHQMIKND